MFSTQTRLILFFLLLMLLMPLVLSMGAAGIMLEGGILIVLLFLLPWLWGMVWEKLVALSDERGPSRWVQRSKPAITRMRWIGTLVAIPVFFILVSGKLHGTWLIILVCAEVLFVLVEIALLLALKIGESPLRFLPTLVRTLWDRPPRPSVPKPPSLAQASEASEAVPHDDGNQQGPAQEVEGLPYDELQRYEQGYQRQDLPSRSTPPFFSAHLLSERSRQSRQKQWGE